MTFWDSSAIVPLLVSEERTPALQSFLNEDQTLLTWWATPVECASAIARRERDDSLTAEEASQALARLKALSEAWHEIAPSETTRRIAVRLLRVHPLRAADSLQLAAAIVAAEREPESLPLLTLDERLQVAAEKEGFPLVSV